jgi:multiple sugar transport system substrate-binding protein
MVPYLSLAQGKITLSFMDHADPRGVNAKIIKLYESRNPNVKVEYIQTPAGGADRVHDKQATMMAAGDGSIDIINTDVIWPPEFAAAGWLLPLDDVFPPEVQKQYVPAMIDAQTVGGHIYGFPYLNDIGNFYYRKDILEQAGADVPETWFDLVEVSQKLQRQPDLIGYIATFFPDQQLMCNYTEYLWSNNGEFFDSTGKKIMFTSPQSVEAVQFMVDLIHKYKIVQPGITTMGLDDGRKIFTEGKAIFHRNWNYAWARSQSPESKIAGKVGLDKVPRFPNGPFATTLGGWSFSVNRFTKYKKESAELAKFLGGWDAQKIRAIEGERTPTILKLLNDPDVVAVYPVYPRMMDTAYGAKARPKSPFYTQISDIFQKELSQALILRKTPRQALQDAAREIEPIISGM